MEKFAGVWIMMIKIGVHYNFDDFSNGKGADVIKKVIPIDISYDEYTQILDLWN